MPRPDPLAAPLAENQPPEPPSFDELLKRTHAMFEMKRVSRQARNDVISDTAAARKRQKDALAAARTQAREKQWSPWKVGSIKAPPLDFHPGKRAAVSEFLEPDVEKAVYQATSERWTPNAMREAASLAEEFISTGKLRHSLAGLAPEQRAAFNAVLREKAPKGKAGIGESFGRGVTDVARSLWTSVQREAASLAPLSLGDPRAQEQFRQQRQTTGIVRSEKPTTGVLAKTAQMLPGMGSIALAGLAGGPTAALAVAAMQETPDAIADMEDAGVAPNLARKLGTATGLAIAAIEFAQVNQIVPGAVTPLKKLIGKSVRRVLIKGAKKWATTTVGETLEEAAQAFVGTTMTEVAKWADANVEDPKAREALKKAVGDAIAAAKESWGPLAIIGGAGHAPRVGISAVAAPFAEPTIAPGTETAERAEAIAGRFAKRGRAVQEAHPGISPELRPRAEAAAIQKGGPASRPQSPLEPSIEEGEVVAEPGAAFAGRPLGIAAVPKAEPGAGFTGRAVGIAAVPKAKPGAGFTGRAVGIAAVPKAKAPVLKTPERRVTKDIVQEQFPGSTVAETKTGYAVAFKGGQTLSVEFTPKLEPNWAQLEKDYGREFAPEDRADIEQFGAFKVKFNDGTEKSGLGVILLAEGVADDASLRHEAMHLARTQGFLTGQEWRTLVEKYSDTSKSERQQQEDVAGAAGAWSGKAGLGVRIRAWLMDLMQKFGLKKFPDAASVQALFQKPELWARASKTVVKPGDLAGVAVRAPAAPGALAEIRKKKVPLAIHAKAPAARKLTRAVDIAREEAGKPTPRARLVAQKQAGARMKTNLAEERRKFKATIQTGDAFTTEADAVVASRIAEQQAVSAVRTGDLGAHVDAVRFVNGLREGRAEVARILGLRDPVETPAQRTARNLASAIARPSEGIQRRIDAARQQGDTKAIEAAIKDAALENKKIVAAIEEAGLPITNVDAIASDPVAAARALNEIGARKAGRFAWSRSTNMLHEFWMNSILSLPTTHVANIAGTVGYGSWRMFGRRAIESAINLPLGRKDAASFAEFKYLLGGMLPGVARGARNFLRSWRTERPALAESLGRKGRAKREEARIAIPGRLGRAIRTPGFRLLTAVDEFNKSVIAQMEVGAQAARIAKGEGLKGEALQARVQELVADNGSAAWDAAMTEAVVGSFQERPGRAVRSILGVRRAVPGARYLLPFVTTPANIFVAGLKMTPLGSLPLGHKIIRGLRTGNWSGITANAAEQAVGLAAFGLLLMTNDDEEPWITGTQGHPALQRQSIRVGGKAYSYSRIEPFATALALMVDFSNAIKGGKGDAGLAQIPISSIRGQLNDKTFVRGLSDIANIMSGEKGGVEKWATNFVASFVPNIVRGGIREAVTEVPERRIWGKKAERWQRFVRRTMQKAEVFRPVLGEEPKFDIWGRPIERAKGSHPLTDWVYRITVPVRVRDEKLHPGDRLYMAWNNAHPNEPLPYPRLPRPTYTVDGKPRSMTDAQYTEYLRLAGKASDVAVRKLFAKRLDPTEEDMDTLADAFSMARRDAKKEIVQKWTVHDAPPTAGALGVSVYGKRVLAKAGVLSRAPPEDKTKRAQWITEARAADEWLNRRSVSGIAAARLIVKERKKDKKWSAADAAALKRFVQHRKALKKQRR